MKMVLEQRQMLKMVMTTELRQAIELLQFSTYELMQFVQKQAEENPLIELVENEYTDFSYTRPSRTSFKSDNKEVDPLDFVVQDEKSLSDHLLEQVNLLHITEVEQHLLYFLILNLDEQGFLKMTNEEIAQFLNIDEIEVEKGRRILHRLEPLGVGARDVAECLSIQAREVYPEDERLIEVLELHLERLADRQWKKIAQACNISMDEVNEIFEKIQTLNPKPAMNFATRQVDYVTPDIFVEVGEDHQTYSVTLNHHYIPEIRYNFQYANELRSSKDLSQYVNQHFRKFEWLQKSIEQRRETILKVMEVIINRQREFFHKGFRSLKPLTLKEVADAIDMHESTVSRATANKIVQTPVGTFALRHLFSTRLATEGENDASQTKVKELLRELIDAENKNKPLSDQKLANLLKDEKGIVISRRTVAKYRDEMQIPSSSRRKNMKK